MRRKTPKAPPPAQPTDDKTYVVAQTGHRITEAEAARLNSISTLTRIVERVMDLQVPVTPGQIIDGSEMFIALMHARGVTPDFFTDHLMQATRLVSLATRVDAEARMSAIPMPDTSLVTVRDAMDLSSKEINELRVKIGKSLKLLSELPLPGVTVH